MEATIKTLATKDDIAKVKNDLSKKLASSVKWMIVFWISQFGATMAILFLLLKK